ncbi:ankyrin repeat domain-containing protein [Microbulbifer sp. VTAC004]|uniref:ankyrin repeat domain-containing protein n=1 Tax=unclassified Microbulbifer TaxID=2619833 RepID=UPI004039543A
MSKENFDLLINAVMQDKSLAEKLISEDPEIVHAKNGIGETVLHYLAVEDHLDEVAWLLARGSEINTANEFGNNPLSEAASLGYYELCEFLLKESANPRQKTPDGDTALSEAAINNEHNVAELLLGYVEPAETLQDYFSYVGYEVLLDKESQSAKLINLKGLKW